MPVKHFLSEPAIWVSLSEFTDANGNNSVTKGESCIFKIFY